MRNSILAAIALAVTLLPAIGFADSISLDPASSAPAHLRPISAASPDNPLHLTASQQVRINARKLKFQSDATALMANSRLSGVAKGPQLDAMQRQAQQDIYAMLTPRQVAAIAAAQRSVERRASTELKALKRRQALESEYVSDRKTLAASVSAAQAKQMVSLANSTEDRLRAVTSDSKLSRKQKGARLAAILREYDLQRVRIFTPSQRRLANEMDRIRRQLSAAAP